jgi:hypothetical protein
MRLRRTVFVVTLVAIASVFRATPADAANVLGSCGQSVGGDFNADGAYDLAVGVPNDDVTGIANAGAVNVIYGLAGTGLDASDNQFITQDSPGVNDKAEAGDQFGGCLAAGDFNGDSEDDLAIGIPGEDVNGVVDAGAISVIYGNTPSGLDALGPPTDDFFHQGTSGIPGDNEEGDQFGSTLAAGFFNDDIREDLSVGAPFEDIVDLLDAGAAWVFNGANGGLTLTGIDLFWQDGPNVAETAERDDKFGQAFAAGDFDGDGTQDLAVGVPEENVGSIQDAGMVHIFYSNQSGLNANRDRVISQNTGGVADGAELNDLFSRSLASGDFDGDGTFDLAVGVPREDLPGATDAGFVNVLFGSFSPAGIQPGGNFEMQSTMGGADEAGDQFASALVASDFDGDSVYDLAAGAPFEDLTANDAGAVNTVLGVAGSGLTGTALEITQNSVTADPDGEEASDRFGTSLVTGDYDADGAFDLSMSAFREDVNGVADAGAVDVAYSANPATSQYWVQDDLNDDGGEPQDNFGLTLG